MFLKISQNSQEKHLCQSLFFDKVAGLRPEACMFIKKETLAQVFSCKFCEISENTFFTEQLRNRCSLGNLLHIFRTAFVENTSWGLLLTIQKTVFVNPSKQNWSFRNSCPEVFCKKGVLRNFVKFTERHLCQRLSYKVAGLRPTALLKKRPWHRCFPVNFAKFLEIPFLQNTSSGCL